MYREDYYYPERVNCRIGSLEMTLAAMIQKKVR